jgi:site-specific recombinase XerD
MAEVRCWRVFEWPGPDQIAWVAATRRSRRLLEEDGLAADWSRATVRTISRGYGRWLHWLYRESLLDRDARPEARVTPERVAAYVSELRRLNAETTVAARVRELSRAIGVMAPRFERGWLIELATNLVVAAEPVRDDRARLHPARAIWAAAIRLMEEAEAAAPKVRRAPAQFRDGLMLALLCICPLRARNLAELELGRNLRCADGIWTLRLAATETKNRKAITLPLPEAISPWIARYVDHHRPRLLARARKGPPGDRFYLTERGTVFRENGINYRINAVTERVLGRAMNPHAFRKLMPTELAIHDPTHVGISQPLLNHASYRTTQEHYNLGRAIDASRRMNDLVGQVRAHSKAGGTMDKAHVRALRRMPVRNG